MQVEASDPNIEIIANPDLDQVERLLKAAGLPVADIYTPITAFTGLGTGGHLVATGGLETYGPFGLLRSVAVEESARGKGLGTRMSALLEERAAATGVERLFLLTTTAREFFAERGYREFDREQVPRAIRETSEFQDLCPESAVVMARRLD